VFSIFILFFSDYHDRGLIALAILTVWSACLSLEWYYQYKGQYKRLFIRTFIIRSASLIALFGLVNSPEDYTNYATILLLMLLLPNLYNLYFYRLADQLNLKQMFSLSHIKRYANGLITNSSIGFFVSVYTLIPIAMAAILLSAEAFSYISLSDRIVKLVVSLTASFSIVLLPKQVEMFYDNRQAAEAYLIKLINLTLAICIYMAFLTAINAQLIVTILGGESFFESIKVLVLMAPLLLLMPLNSIITYQYFYATKKLRKLLNIAGVIAGVAVALTYGLIENFGSNGYVLAIITTETLLFVALYWQAFGVKRLLSFSFKVLTYSLLLALIWFIVKSISPNDWSILYKSMATNFLSVLIYVPVLVLFKWSPFHSIFLQVKQRL